MSAANSADVPDPRPQPVAGSPPAPGQLGGGDLSWTEVADIVWLASVKQAVPGDEPPPAAPAATAPPAAPPRDRDQDASSEKQPEPERPRSIEPAITALPQELAAVAAVPRPELRVLTGDGVATTGVALPESLQYFRALRSLKRTIPSWHEDDVVLDEDATAEQAAETGSWWPITTPRRERWLDLTLVIDGSPTMALWRDRVTAFVELVERLGAFRSIQVRQLDTMKAGGKLTPVLRGGTAGAPVRDPAEVLDNSGRRVALLITDGVGDVWQHEVLFPMLARWARAMPVSVVHLLPQRLWPDCGVDVHRARLSVPGKVKPNSRWHFDLPDAWLEPDPTAVAPPGTVPVPVLELRPRWLRWWAGLITGEYRDLTDGAVLLATDNPFEREYSNSPEPANAEERVQRFRSMASPPALRLATLLAAVPVHTDVAQLVRQRFVPEAGPEGLAELLIYGILYAPGPRDGRSTWDTGGPLVFPKAVRELLLSGARRSETASVVRVAANHFGDRIPVLGHLRDAIADPNNTKDPEFTLESSAEDVELESVVMRALSGPYLSRADRLRNVVLPAAEAAGLSKPESIKNPARVKMRETTAQRAEQPTKSPSADDPTQPSDADLAEQRTTPLLPAALLASRTFPKRQPDDPPPVWANVPPRNPNFTGRADLLEQLGKRLTAGGTTAVLPSALHGMGGIGKTQMAAEYIYRHLADYDLVWWLDAAHPTQIRAGLADLARTLGVPGAADASVAVPAVLEALRTGRPLRRWLLVFDAAESPEDVLPYCPRNGPGEILITSRNSDWAGIARPLEIAIFKREESIELLGRRGPEITQADANQLAERLGDLPLAVGQAAAWRAVTGMPVQEYLRLFDESVAEILDTASAPEYEVSVAAAWNVSFDELKTRNPAAHQILHICAFFSPEPISRDLLTGVTRVSISPELDSALRDPIKLARAIRDINRYGLAKIDHGNNTLQLHRLVQLVLRKRVMAPQVHAQMQHGAHQLLASLDPNDPDQSRNWPRYRELLPHAYAANVMSCDEDWPRQLIINLMRFLFESGDHEEAARLGELAREEFNKVLGPTHEQSLEVSSRLGQYLAAVGRYRKAAELNQRTLALRLQVSGEENEEIFALQRNILFDLRVQGDFAAGAKLSEEVYQKSLRMFGIDDPETLYAAFQHGISLRLAGEYRKAAELDEETYRRRSEVLGPDHPRTFSVRAAMIVDRREAGDYGQARVMQEALAEQGNARYGEGNPNVATDSFYLSVTRRKDGDHNGALPLSARALERLRLVYGDDHGTTMACALGHSIDLRHASDLGGAKALGEQTFERYRRDLGEHHPHTLAASVDLAVTLRIQGDVAGARALDERALEHFRAGIGPDHPYAIITTVNLASDLSAMGELDRAIELGRDALERGSRVLGENHPTVLAAAFNLGLDLDAAGHVEEARPYQGPILAKYRTVLGEAHPGTQAAGGGARADCDIDPMLM